MNADGYVTIGTKLDTKGLEKGLRQAESELKKYEAEAKRLSEQKLKIEAEANNKELEDQINFYDDLTYKVQKHNSEAKKLRAEQDALIHQGKDLEAFELGYKFSQTHDTKGFTQAKEILREDEQHIKELRSEYGKYLQKLDEVNAKIRENASNQEKVKATIKQTNTELQRSRSLDNIRGAIDNIQNKMGKIVKTAIRWGLAIFGIRSAYMFVRNAMSTLTQYDTQMATNVEYMRWALAMSLKPVIEYIIKLAYQLLGVLRYIIKLLFNYDIFAKAGAEQFRKAKENTSGVSKNLGTATKKAKALNKELNKQLASFDEMNILGDNVKQAGDTGSADGGTPAVGGSGITMPSLEIPEIKEIKIDWANIFDNIKLWIGKITGWAGLQVDNFFGGIGQRFYDNAHGWTAPISNTIGDFFKTLGKMARLEIDGIGNVFGGLVEIIKGIFTGDLPSIVSGAFQVLQGIVQIGISSIGSMFNVLATPFRLVFNTMMSIAESFFNWLSRTFKLPGLKWDNLMVGLGNTIDKIKSKFTSLKNNIGTIFKNIGTTVGNLFKSAFKIIFNKLMSAVESRLNKPIGAINTMIGTINKLLPKSKKMSKLKGIKLPRLATGGIVNMPGKGVPVGTAIAGERGAEGVIPLTDSQQMALLGEAIGKYITINANITNNMNGRVISRELQKIQNDNNFAYNR